VLLSALALALSTVAHADDSPAKPPTPDKPPPGYRDMTIDIGGKPMTIRVPDEHKNTLKNNGPANAGPYDPTNLELNHPSSYANKSFSTSEAILSKDDGTHLTHDQKRFETSPFATGSYNQSDRTFETAAYKSSSRSSDDFAKSYQLPGAASDANRSYDVKGSDLQDRKALIADNPKEKTDPFATPWSDSDKRFFDPAMTHVKRDPYAAANGLDVEHLNNLPNRPLSIDEVRNLINHEQVPDLSKPPETESKPLNDPNWEPTLSTPALSNKAAPATPPPDETKADELPSPGMMAKPDDSQPIAK
jgi:hypothetical protein